MDAEMDSVITNTGVSEKYTMKQELPFCSYMIHIKQPVNHEWSADDIVQDECTMQSM
ncbi:hypothetical protein T12_9691 [Trichinella patagoniensis]|uniref:Uncharacterized protein n=1 Tax=Trichinella patagoniensis TaxID=990121 RepID=A0A0V0Z574_9BILA|nr:hypothetical protein T12_9691 [Trichinella patagoniensis]